MSRRFKILLLALLVIPAGCTTGRRQPPPDVDLTPEARIPAKPMPVPPPKPMPAPLPAPKPVAPKPTPPAHTNPVPYVETWISLEHWCHANHLGAPRRTVTDSGTEYSFNLSNGTVVLRIGSHAASWRGTELHLGYAPLIIGGRPYIYSLDARKNFLPLMEPPDHLETGRVIVIDPGHGGTDNGTRSVFNSHFEKEYTLDWARRLQSLLATNGWTVRLTRTSDTTVALSNRVAFAELHKPDFFLSLHFNSVPDRDVEGSQTYCVTPRGMPSNETRDYLDDSSRLFPNNRFDAENLRYAMRIQRALLKVNGHLDRGVIHARFLTVLRGQNRPAVLIEGGYLSNPAEARRIDDPAYREKLAVAVAKALEETSGNGLEQTVSNAVTTSNQNELRAAEHPGEKSE